MQRVMFAAAVVAMLTSCAQWPIIQGAYADWLTYHDIIEIRALVQHRPELRPIFRIWMHWPDRALVDTGTVANTGDTITSFIARKKNGRWAIDESSIEKNRAIVTSDNRSFTQRPNQSLQPTAGRSDV